VNLLEVEQQEIIRYLTEKNYRLMAYSSMNGHVLEAEKEQTAKGS